MSSTSTLNISLTPELEGFVQERLSNGSYATSSEMVQEGLRLLQQREREADEALRLLRTKLSRASDQADRGELVEGAEVFAKVDALIDRRRQEREAQGK